MINKENIMEQKKANEKLCKIIIYAYNNNEIHDLNKYYSSTKPLDLILLYNYDNKKNTKILDYLCRPF